MLRGFLIDISFVLESGAPLLRLYGRAEDGRPFLVRERRARPYFFVPAASAAAVPQARPTELRTLLGEPVMRVEGLQPTAHAQLAESLRLRGIRCFESDLRFTSRFLIDRGLRGLIGIEGTFREQGGLRIFDEPRLVPVDPSQLPPPPLRLVSIDIETDPRAERLLSIALHGSGPDEVLLCAPRLRTAPDKTRLFANEAELLAAFCAALCARDPDVITGWNVIDFDLTVLQKIGQRVGVPLRLGRDGSEPYLRPARSFFASSSADLTGRVVLDGIQLLRGSFVQLEEYGLDFVARHVLGVGKTLSSPHRAEEISRVYEEDPERFVAYNLNDAQLVTRILGRLNLIELSVQRSLLTGMPLDQVSLSIASFDSLYLPELRRRGVVAPSVHIEDEATSPMQGGLVLDPQPGTYKNVLVFDFKSLYPSVIRTFNIDPLGKLRGVEPDGSGGAEIRAPSGVRFRREPAILPGILDALFPQREAAKKRGDSIASHAIKILMNSLYGVFGAPACRFFDADIANAITGFGREILSFARGHFEQSGYRVLYGDTDSLFVLAGTDDAAAAAGLIGPLLAELNAAITRHVREHWDVQSRLELELDAHYHRLFLPSMRAGSGGARKRYAGLIEEGGERRVVFTGMEVVRRDSTELAKRVQRELFERLFADRPVDEYLRETVRAVLAGAQDELLVYRKALRKPLESYTASTPPHVAAARKLGGAPTRIISYVMTVQGPEPIEALRHAIDRSHYIEKQVRPVAEPVLDALGLDFDVIVDAPGRQLSLL